MTTFHTVWLQNSAPPPTSKGADAMTAAGADPAMGHQQQNGGINEMGAVPGDGKHRQQGGVRNGDVELAMQRGSEVGTLVLQGVAALLHSGRLTASCVPSWYQLCLSVSALSAAGSPALSTCACPAASLQLSGSGHLPMHLPGKPSQCCRPDSSETDPCRWAAGPEQ